MRPALTISFLLSMLLICAPAIAQKAVVEHVDMPGSVPELPLEAPALPAIFSAVPADAFGFIATGNLQASYDNIMLFAKALGAPVPPENQLLAIQEHLGQIDLNGSAAAILLDPQKFSEPVALLFSAADARAVFEAHQAKAPDIDEEDLPAGVIKAPDGYLAVKNGFIVFAPQAEQVAAVLASQTPLQVMPAAMQDFAQGKIVLAGDIEQAAPFLVQSLDGIKAQMTAQMSRGPQMQQTAMAKDMFSLYFDFAQSFIQQADQLAIALDINAEQALLIKRVLFKADSQAAAFVNAQIGQELPSYTALPGGSFLLAGVSSLAPEQLNSFTETVLNKLFELPSIKEKFSAEHAAQMIADSKAGNALLSGLAFTVNLGNPMTGMINAVIRYDVTDSAAHRQLTAKMYQADYMSAYMSAFSGQSTGGPLMDMIYTSAAENYSGVDIDTIKLQMTPPEPPAEDDPMAPQKQMMAAQQMQMMAMMYGPDMTFRMAAPNDKQVLFVMGGSGRMEQAINVAQGNGSVLADDPKIAQAAAKLPANRFAEAHLDLGQVVPMIGMFVAMAGGPPMPPAQAPVAPPISFSTTAQTNTLRADVVVPSETIGSLVQTFMAMKMQMMQQQGGPGMSPQEMPSENFEEGDFDDNEDGEGSEDSEGSEGSENE